MIIGIDASRAYISDKTGTENYSYHLINTLVRLPESKSHTFVLFTRPNPIMPSELVGYTNVIVKIVNWPYLWTQAGLAWETWKNIVNPYSSITVNPDLKNGDKRIHGFTDSRYLDVLWIPAHTLPVLRNPKMKTVVTIHGLEYQWLPEYKNLLQRWYLPLSTIYAAKAADKLIAVSQFTAKQLQEQLHTSPKKIKVIYEGVAIHTPGVLVCHGDTVSLQKYGLEHKKYVLFVGSVQPRKNLVALIESFSLVAKDLPDYKLVIAGGIGWMAEEVLQAASRYGVQEKVVFTGRISDLDLRELYAGAVVYVQPSITEGFGLPILEAMAAGIPVISSDGGALREVVGEAGIVVPLSLRPSPNKVRNFVTGLAEEIKRVIGDKQLQKKLIAMGLERVKEFGWEKAARATLKEIVGEGYNNSHTS